MESECRQITYCLNLIVALWSHEAYYYFHLQMRGLHPGKCHLINSLRELLVVWHCPSWARFNLGARLIIQRIKAPCSNYCGVCLIHAFFKKLYFIFILDLFWTLLCSHKSLQESSNLLWEYYWNVQREETSRDAATHLCHIWICLQMHASRWVEMSECSVFRIP